MTFANILDPDQARQNVGTALDPSCLTLWLNSWNIFFRKSWFWKKSIDDKKHATEKCKVWLFFMVIFLWINFLGEIILGKPSELQTDWSGTRLRHDVLSGMCWVQSVCKCRGRQIFNRWRVLWIAGQWTNALHKMVYNGMTVDDSKIHMKAHEEETNHLREINHLCHVKLFIPIIWVMLSMTSVRLTLEWSFFIDYKELLIAPVFKSLHFLRL